MATNAFAAGAYAADPEPRPAPAAGPRRRPRCGRRPRRISRSLLQDALDGVAETGKAAEAQALAAATGKADIVDVVTAVAESEAALETLVAVRDRVIAAYEDIMRMPI